jgi:hypothetical protein
MVRFTWTGWWLGLIVGLMVSTAGAAAAQARTPPDPLRVELKENTPNPIVTSTTIPFVLYPEVCAKGHQPLVSLKIYNVLVQVVAVPTLASDTTTPLDRIRLRCGEYRAYWDGRFLDRQEAPQGVYYYQLTVDGERYTRKMTVQRRVTSGK